MPICNCLSHRKLKLKFLSLESMTSIHPGICKSLRGTFPPLRAKLVSIMWLKCAEDSAGLDWVSNLKPCCHRMMHQTGTLEKRSCPIPSLIHSDRVITSGLARPCKLCPLTPWPRPLGTPTSSKLVTKCQTLIARNTEIAT